MHSSRMRAVRCSSRLLKGGVSPGRGGCLPGGCLPGGLPGGWECLPSLSRGVSGRHPLWTDFLTHTCENITFPQLHLRTLIITTHKRNLGQGNVFTPICHSVQRGEGELASQHASQGGLPSGGVCIQRGGGLPPEGG